MDRFEEAEISEEMKEMAPLLKSKPILSNNLDLNHPETRREQKHDRRSTHDPWESFFSKWKKIFVTSCVFAVLLDPLFLYIPIINQDLQCLSLDSDLKIIALILRSLTDLFNVMDIIFRIYGSESRSSLLDELHDRHFSDFLLNFFLPSIAKMVGWYIIVDILAILPIPQVLILVFFSRMGASARSTNTKKFVMNFSVMLQYVARVLRIYLSFKELRKSPKEVSTAIWVKGLLNFFMYILASHVLGAIWYFFAIQRMIACWQQACGNGNECESSNFGCHDHGTFQNTTFLSNSCPINPPNTTLFDFGIFLTVLQSSISGSTNHPQKFSNCFWWGLRNLRFLYIWSLTFQLLISNAVYLEKCSLGSNLQPSVDTWENLFAALVSVLGLLLFLYLIGNLQTYMQLNIARLEDHRHKRRIRVKMEEKGEDIELWLSKSGIPKRSNKDIKSQIMEKVQHELEENRDVDVQNILSILPSELQNYIKSRPFFFGYENLKKVQKLQNMDEEVLKAIRERLRPMSYIENSCIIQKNGRLEMMVFVTDGLVNIESIGDANLPENENGSNSYAWLKTGDFYGEELLDWVNHMTFPTLLPLSTITARAIGNVEVLVLTADDLSSVVSMFSSHFSELDFPYPEDALLRLGLDKMTNFRSALRIK